MHTFVLGHHCYEIDLAQGDYPAVVTFRGASLRSLRSGGRQSGVPFDIDSDRIPDYRGIFCALWPNRLAYGRHRWEGREVQDANNEPQRKAALHGMLFDNHWIPSEHDQASLTLETTIVPQRSYPFELTVRVSYNLHSGGLTETVKAFKEGSRTAPYGVCPHPYLVAGASALDEWSLTNPAEQFLAVTRQTSARIGPDRIGPAVEPRTCPADAFSSGKDLIHLDPGHTHTASWTIRAVPRP